MSVKVPAFVLEAIGGSLVEAHRIRERDLEAAIIARGEPLQDVGQTVALVAAQLIQACGVAPTGHKSLERPHCPEGDEGHKMIVGGDDSLAELSLQSEIIAKQA